MPPRIMPRPIPRKVGLATTEPRHAPEQISRAALVPGRGALTEAQPLSPLKKPGDGAAPARSPAALADRKLNARPAPPTPAARLASMVAPELPVRRLAPRRMDGATRIAIAPPRVATVAEKVRAAAAPATPEKPAHAYLSKTGPATDPRAAAINRVMRKSSAVRRGLEGPRVRLGMGVSPTDIANGLQTRHRGIWSVNRKRAPVGTPQALREAPVDELPVSLTPPPSSSAPESSPAAAPPPATPEAFAPKLGIQGPLGISTAGEEADDPPAGSIAAEEQPGEGMGRLLFLGGALWLAWMLFGKGGAS